MKRNRRLLSMLATSVLAVVAQPAWAFDLEGDNQILTHACLDGETITVSGAGNVVTLTGSCGALEVEGVENQVTAAFSGAGVEVEGAYNVVRTGLPPRTPVRITGVNNQVHYRLSQAGAAPVVKAEGVNNRVLRQRR